jgi:hypothetical protein
MTFIDSIKSKALELYKKYNILPSLTIAQACLESAYGTHAPGNNLFGFKWTSTCGYDWQLLWTKEFVNGAYVSVQAKFRKYNSINDSLDDYGKLIGTSQRYAPVLLCKDYTCATDKIRQCGYATSPTYTQSLRKLIEQYKLYELDNGDTMNPNSYLTLNFKYKEFWQGSIEPPAQYFNNVIACATQLQIVRDIIGKPIIITSAYRTLEHNEEIGGAKFSMHLTASAVDSHAIGLDLRIYLAYLIKYTNFGGFCIGNTTKNLIHADLRQVFWVDVYK